MDLVTGTRRIFENPADYDCLEFEDVFEGTTKPIAFFIPTYMVDMKFKDKDGNTDLEKAKEYYLKQLSVLTTPEAVTSSKMNTPIIPSHMWITKSVSILPTEEAKAVKKRLLSDDMYKKQRTFVKLFWDSNKVNGVDYKIIPENEANSIDSFMDSQGSNKKKNKGNKTTDTDIIIYEFPEVSKYNDLYKFTGLDPYVADEQDKGGSLGSFYILKNPKYISEGISGDIIVAEITGKYESRAVFNEMIEKLLAFYNNPKRALMFEANRGDDVKEYFLKHHKEYLLALTPVSYEDTKVDIGKVKLSYGYFVGNDISKLHNMNQLAEWLLEETTIAGIAMKNIERIPSLGLLDEIIEYDWQRDKEKKANYDRISAFIGCIIARRENFNQYTKNETNRTKVGKLAGYSQKPLIQKLKNKHYGFHSRLESTQSPYSRN